MPSHKSRVPTSPAPTASPASTTHHSFEDVDTLRSSDGIKAVISQRRANGVFTFALFREFERDGVVQQGAFVPEELGASYLGMVQRTLARIAEIKKSGKAPFPVR